jgi:Tfp pilus assembly protein PilV
MYAHLRNFRNSRKRGVSLIEGVLYLVIALAVIVGGIVFFQQAQLSNNVTDTARAGVGISSQTRGLYQNQRNFGTADITPALVAAGAVPSNFLNTDGDGIVHPFGGGAVTVTGQGDFFTLTFAGLPEAACLRLMTIGDDGAGPLGTGMLGVEMNAAAFSQAAPVSAADLAGACTDDNTVVAHYARADGGAFTPTMVAPPPPPP